MQEKFAEWYTNMSFGVDSRSSGGRWSAIEALVQDASKSTLELLTRLAFRLKPQMSAQDVADLREKLAGGLPPPGDEELIMLAASALAWAMDPEGGDDPVAATMVTTASCAGLRALEQPMDLLGMSKRANARFAESGRRRPTTKISKPLPSSLDKTDVAGITKLAAEGNHLEAFKAVITSIDKVFAVYARRQTAIEGEFQKYAKVQDEELDILWWLQGGHCADLQKDFVDVPPEFRPLAISRELATMTKVLPGPISVPSLLSRAGIAQAPSTSIVVATQGMPVAWFDLALGDVKPDEISPVTTPILFALSRRKEMEGAEGWAAAWSKLTMLSSDSPLEPMLLADAAYREFLLAKLG